MRIGRKGMALSLHTNGPTYHTYRVALLPNKPCKDDT